MPPGGAACAEHKQLLREWSGEGLRQERTCGSIASMRCMRSCSAVGSGSGGCGCFCALPYPQLA